MSTILEDIKKLPHGWHKSGNLAADQLQRIHELCAALGAKYTAETGCGKSTLVLSHVSKKHVSFTTDWGESLKTTRASPLLNSGAVEFAVGSTQVTLPAFKFTEPLDFALIDGPHGYPFPDLEYYYFYPHLRTGAVLAIDDTHIPTIARMYEIISEDAMFEPIGNIRNLAFLRRTSHKTFPPLADGWYEQAYNLNHFENPKDLEGLYGPEWWVNRDKRSIPKRIS